MDSSGKTLYIDPAFKALIRPLRRDAYAQLEASLVLDGCREPIIMNNGVIVDGHNRYEICNRLHIPYGIQAIALERREAAISYICGNQLARKDIPEEMRKYLVGRQYEAERALCFCEQTGQYQESSRRTAIRLGKSHCLSLYTVQKCGKYSAVLDAIAGIVPALRTKILSGNYRISYDNLVALSMLEADELRQFSQKAGSANRHSQSRQSTQEAPAQKPNAPELPVIKTMPTFDPDAEATCLTLTIPSWISSIERAWGAADLRSVSPSARLRLESALLLLQSKTQDIIRAIKEAT